MCVEAVGYLLEELRNPETLANFKKVVFSPASLITKYLLACDSNDGCVLVSNAPKFNPKVGGLHPNVGVYTLLWVFIP